MTFDIIEQKQEMLAAIIDSSDDAIISKNLNGVITSWNKAAEIMFEYTDKEAVGQHIFLIIPEDLRNEEDIIISSLKQGKRIDHYQTIRQTRSGRKLNISLTISPIKNKAGIVTGASKIARDITRQKHDEEVIKRHNHQLKLINTVGKKIASKLEASSIMQVVTDATTELAGAAFGAFFYNKTDSRGNSYILYSLSGAPREAFEKFGMPRATELFQKTFSGESIVRSDNITKDRMYGNNHPHKGIPDGHPTVVSYLAVPVISQSGVVIGGLFFGHPDEAVFKMEHEILVNSIASQASIALENAKLYEDIQAMNSKKDDFIKFASHEFKTPLTTMSGYLQLLGSDHSLLPQFLPKVNKQVIRLQSLVADLLDISKIQAKEMILSFTRINLRELIKESIESIQEENHTITYDIPAGNIQLNIDKQKILQVITNLLSNAIKYSPAGSDVVIGAVQVADQIEVSIRDHGIGIAAEHLEHIFSQYYRISSSSKSADGMGLGLFICKTIIERHLGKIRVESELGKGSVFQISFPIDISKSM